MVSSAGVVKSQHGNAKPRRRDASNGQTAKKREMDRIAQKKSRERSKHRMQELEDKLNRLQDDDKQKQISELMDTIDELRRENERLRTMTERIRGLAEAAGPPLPRSGIQSASDTHGKQSPSPVSNSSEDYRMAASQQGHNYIQEMWQNPELTPVNKSVASNGRYGIKIISPRLPVQRTSTHCHSLMEIRPVIWHPE